MGLVASVGSQEQAAAVVQPGEGALDDPAVAAEPGAVLGQAASDQRLDAPLANELPVAVVVVAAVGDQRSRSPPRSPDTAAHRRNAVEQGQQLGDVVAVAAGQ